MNSWCGCLRPPWGEDLQECLLHALARHVARDRRVLGLARYLIDLVDVDDAALGALDVVVGGLQQSQDNVLDVLAYIAGFGEGRRVGDRERHPQHLGERLGQQGLTRAGRADHQDVRLLQLDVAGLVARLDALVVVVHRDGENLLGALLTDDVLIEDGLDLGGLREAAQLARLLLFPFLRDDVVTELDALVADVDGRSRDQLANVVLALAAERAPQGSVAFARPGHAVVTSGS
jgi:hypothetical protein